MTICPQTKTTACAKRLYVSEYDDSLSLLSPFDDSFQWSESGQGSSGEHVNVPIVNPICLKDLQKELSTKHRSHCHDNSKECNTHGSSLSDESRRRRRRKEPLGRRSSLFTKPFESYVRAEERLLRSCPSLLDSSHSKEHNRLLTSRARSSPRNKESQPTRAIRGRGIVEERSARDLLEEDAHSTRHALRGSASKGAQGQLSVASEHRRLNKSASSKQRNRGGRLHNSCSFFDLPGSNKDKGHIPRSSVTETGAGNRLHNTTRSTKAAKDVGSMSQASTKEGAFVLKSSFGDFAVQEVRSSSLASRLSSTRTTSTAQEIAPQRANCGSALSSKCDHRRHSAGRELGRSANASEHGNEARQSYSESTSTIGSLTMSRSEHGRKSRRSYSESTSTISSLSMSRSEHGRKAQQSYTDSTSTVGSSTMSRSEHGRNARRSCTESTSTVGSSTMSGSSHGNEQRRRRSLSRTRRTNRSRTGSISLLAPGEKLFIPDERRRKARANSCSLNSKRSKKQDARLEARREHQAERTRRRQSRSGYKMPKQATSATTESLETATEDLTKKQMARIALNPAEENKAAQWEKRAAIQMLLNL